MFTLSNIASDDYGLSVVASGYSNRQLFLDVVDGFYYVVPVYLINGTNVLLNVKQSNGAPLSDVYIVVRSFVNGVLTPVSYGLSNGQVQFDSVSFPIVVPLYNRSLMDMGSSNFGFEVGDRVFLVVLINIIVFGVGFLAMGTLGGAVLMFINSFIFFIFVFAGRRKF